ncbi:purine permease [Paenibacillus albiflavus]|uniref:Purine permease n=1 Tax=Paenibacillus albiflavus TaxID=2545760 RepID=A0A4R4EI16_9BACL|nr:purine/pyrimidine permease [Paenibacillus albiflavus]TCZ79337.1 purine permease [Paenibacillus albiflavus]
MKTILSSLQWTLFIIAGNLVAPIAIASVFHLDPADTLLFIQRTLFVLGVAGLIQVLFGHRLPIHEGPAGLWWGVFTLYASLGVTLFGSETETLRVLSFSLIVSGIICIILSLMGFIEKLARLFSPMVIGTYLILLVTQLSGSFVKGMLGISGVNVKIDGTVALISIGLVLLSLILDKFASLAQYSIIILIAIGWGLFYYFDLVPPITMPNEWFHLPDIFVFGTPRMEWSMIPTVILLTLLLITNMVATVRVVENVLKGNKEYERKVSMKRTGLFTGVSQIIGGIFSAVGSVPISGAAGFIASTRIKDRLPFIIASCLVLFVSIFMPILAVFAALPSAVGYAAIFLIFSKMLGMAIKEYKQSKDTNYFYKAVGFSLFVGIGVMFIPSAAFTGLPPIVTSFFSNGLILGTVVALIFEIINRKK